MKLFYLGTFSAVFAFVGGAARTVPAWLSVAILVTVALVNFAGAALGRWKLMEAVCYHCGAEFHFKSEIRNHRCDHWDVDCEPAISSEMAMLRRKAGR